jgi:twitching motility protein PilI
LEVVSPRTVVVPEYCRRFPESQRNQETPKTVIRCDRFLRGSFAQGDEIWPVLSLKSLVESDEFLNAADTTPTAS